MRRITSRFAGSPEAGQETQGHRRQECQRPGSQLRQVSPAARRCQPHLARHCVYWRPPTAPLLSAIANNPARNAPDGVDEARPRRKRKPAMMIEARNCRSPIIAHWATSSSLWARGLRWGATSTRIAFRLAAASVHTDQDARQSMANSSENGQVGGSTAVRRRAPAPQTQVHRSDPSRAKSEARRRSSSIAG